MACLTVNLPNEWMQLISVNRDDEQCQKGSSHLSHRHRFIRAIAMRCLIGVGLSGAEVHCGEYGSDFGLRATTEAVPKAFH